MNGIPSSAGGLLRERHGHGRVGYIELFFDLVFVYAITCLSHALLHHFSASGGLETLMLMLAVWWMWICTSWVTNWLDPEKIPVRLALLVLMLLGLILSMSIGEAFGEKGFAFAAAYVISQVGRPLFVIWAAKGDPLMVRNFQRICAWAALSGIFWIAGGFADGMARIALWALGLGLDYTSAFLGFRTPFIGKSTTTDWEIEGGHFSERCALFIIIALGETIMLTGGQFAELPWNVTNSSAFLISFLGTVTMWWLYFNTAAEVGTERISHSDDPGRLARLAYTYLHLFLVAGIILAAVADELVLHHPAGHSSTGTVISVLGSVGLYLIGNLLFKRIVVGRTPFSHVTGIVALGITAVFSAHLSPLLLSGIATLVMIAVAGWEYRARCEVSD